jgi:N-acetylmuramoyl-L-alanine amidase
MKKDKIVLMTGIIFLVILLATMTKAENTPQLTTMAEDYQYNPEQYFYPSMNNPSNFMTWQNEYCNLTESMDFIVEMMPDACQPNPVTSDLLEEQPVPVLCKLTGIKINPFIDVPYIKDIRPIFQNQSKEIAYINFYPARSALGNYQFVTQDSLVTQGNPTLSNLGYVVVSLKQQPVEAKMPNNVSVNVILNITYDVAKTYGLNTQQFILPLMTPQEWQNSYKKYSFWNGKGYVRLQEIKDNNAKISVYINALSNPLKTSQELREGNGFSVRLPGFYCQEGINITLDELKVPKTRARLIINGDEFILEQGDEIADSNCFLDTIEPNDYGYGGKASISCQGAVGPGKYNFDLAPLSAKISIKDESTTQEKDITLSDELKVNVSSDSGYKDEFYYVAHIGKLAEMGKKPVDAIVIFATKTRSSLGEDEKEKIIQAFQDYIMGTNSPELGSGIDIKQILNADSRVRDQLGFVKVIEKGVEIEFGGKFENSVTLNVISVEGPRQVYYSANIEQAYKEAINQYRSIVNQFPQQKDASGIYYGIKALRQASELAKYMFKESDEIDLLQEIVDKYQDYQDEDIQAAVDAAMQDILVISQGSGDKSAIISSDLGEYYVTLLSIDKPGYNSQEARLKINETEGIYLIGDKIDSWVITEINDNNIKLIAPGEEETIAKNSFKYLNGTKIELLSTYIKKEAKVTVWPFERERVTSTNFSIVVGIEKRKIQLTPQQIQKRIQALDKTIDTLGKYVNTLEKITSTWKKVCYMGGSVLWAKNFLQGLSGESVARGIVMKAWTIKCASEDYRKQLGNDKLITVSQCYQKKQNDINTDVSSVKNIVNDANAFVGKVKTVKGVVTSGGILGLTKQINDDAFIREAKNLFLVDSKAKELIDNVKIDVALGRISAQQKLRLLLLEEIQNDTRTCAGKNTSELLKLSEQDARSKTYKDCIISVPVDVRKTIDNLEKISEKGQISVDDIKEIYTILAINKVQVSDVLRAYNNLEIFSKFDKFNSIINSIEASSLKEKLQLNIVTVIDEKKRIEKVSSIDKLTIGIITSKFPQDQGTLNTPDYLDKDFIILQMLSGKKVFSILEKGNNGLYTYSYSKMYYVESISESALKLLNKIDETNDNDKEVLAQLPAIMLEDISKCSYEMAREDYQIRFWDQGPYEGMIAYMPIQRNEGWYFATKAYSGTEGKLVSWKDTGQINEYWICNVGPNGKAEFNFYQGPEGDDGCCIEISKTTSMDIPDQYKAMANKVEKCISTAISSYQKKDNPIKAGDCGTTLSLGKPPVLIPSTQCEDFMSPEECSLLFNLCDPVICPSSRCNMGGRFPVENVQQSGIIGSLVLCLGNSDVAVPICVSGLYNGLDALNNMVFKQYRDCLQKQLDTGQTTGLCDYFNSVYFCQLVWGNLDPFIKAGIPQITSSLTQGGGEYAFFSETFKNSGDSLSYFTQVYGANAFSSFKTRAVNQTGATICDKFVSIVYPTAAKFFDDLTKADSYYQLYASVDEVPMGSGSPESQYRVFYNIYAGKDEPLSYYVYLKKKVTQNYAYESEIQQVRNAIGFLAAGESVSEKRDFTAPAGYNEVCVNINGKDNCGFGTISLSFAVQELQNYYLEDQIKKNIKTEKECQAGSATLIPTASLNLQSQLQEFLQPEIYRRGIIRICASENPGGTTTSERYQRIGYCDKESVGCWLDMNSVNESISDLGIRADIENYSKSQTISYLLDKNIIDTPEQTQYLMDNAKESLKNIKIYLYGESMDEKDGQGQYNIYLNDIKNNILDTDKVTEIKKEIQEDSVINQINELAKNLSLISERALSVEDKSEAEWLKAQILEAKVRFLALADVVLTENAFKQADSCEGKGGEWLASNQLVNGNCPENYEEIKDANDQKDHTSEKCCSKKILEFEQFNQWFTDNYFILGLDKSHQLKLSGTKVYSVGNGKVIEFYTPFFNKLGFDDVYYTVQYADNLYIKYIVHSSVSRKNYVKKNQGVNAGDVLFEMPKGGDITIRVYVDDEKSKRDPLCFFTQDILDKVQEANKAQIPSKFEIQDIEGGVCSKERQGIKIKGVVITPVTPVEVEMKDATIVIDPGHGGSDPGATSSGIKESDINLGVALTLKLLLQSKVKEVILTRESDISLTKSERSRKIIDANPNLVISIHTNSGGGQGSEALIACDQCDNQGTKLVSEVSKCANSCTNLDNKHEKSEELANLILNELANIGLQKRNPPILDIIDSYVLNSVNKPSILIELGFIDNSNDRQILTQKQSDTAQAIYNAISEYFKVQPSTPSGDFSDILLYTEGLDDPYAISYETLETKKRFYATTFEDTIVTSGNYVDPQKDYYCALRVNYNQHDKNWWFNPTKKILLEDPETGNNIICNLEDYGPDTTVTEAAGAMIIDMSTATAKQLFNVDSLGYSQHKEVIVSWSEPTTPATDEIQEVSLVSNQNNGNFETSNRLVEYDEPVEICAVIKKDNQFYSNDYVTGKSSGIQALQGTQPTFAWYKIEPLPKPSYSGAGSSYQLPSYGGKNDFLQYNQVPIQGNGWCINQKSIDSEEGTYWYRVEVTIDTKTYYSDGKAATSSDLSAYQTKYSGFNFTKYSNIMNTLLEPEATANYGISPSVMRISRKSNYAATTCFRNGYNSDDLHCKLISIMESFRYVPFAYGCGFYNCDQVVENPASCPTEISHLSDDFIAISCINLMISALRKTTNQDYLFLDFDSFIDRYSTMQFKNLSMSQIINSSFSFGYEKQVDVGDVLFLANPKGEYYGTYVLYDDTNNNKILDDQDLVVYATSLRETQEGKLNYAPLSNYLNNDYRFTLIKVNGL